MLPIDSGLASRLYAVWQQHLLFIYGPVEVRDWAGLEAIFESLGVGDQEGLWSCFAARFIPYGLQYISFWYCYLCFLSSSCIFCRFCSAASAQKELDPLFDGRLRTPRCFLCWLHVCWACGKYCPVPTKDDVCARTSKIPIVWERGGLTASASFLDLVSFRFPFFRRQRLPKQCMVYSECGMLCCWIVLG